MSIDEGDIVETLKRQMPPCSPSSRSSARNPRHARFASRSLRVAPGCSALPLTTAVRGSVLEGSGRGASRPSLRSGSSTCPAGGVEQGAELGSGPGDLALTGHGNRHRLLLWSFLHATA